MWQILPYLARFPQLKQGSVEQLTLSCPDHNSRALRPGHRSSPMRIGVPKEIKVHEYRVGLVPAGVRELVLAGHEVLIETNAGTGIGVDDEQFKAAGALIATNAAEVFSRADLVVKVKEPQPAECEMLRAGQVLFTYLHLAADPGQAKGLMKSGATAIAYETVTAPNGSLPLLTPMSEVAGRMSIQVGAASLQKANGGFGVLLGGVPGVQPAKVVILGGGVAGKHAAEMAVGMHADVTIVDRSLDRLRELSSTFGASLLTAYSTTETIERLVRDADLVVGAVLVAGAAAPKLVTRAMLSTMKRGAVLVDISIDQGGCFETSRPTTHADPTFVVDGVIHYCVANMPGAVPRTSTFALTNATLPYVRSLADLGWQAALKRDPGLAAGLNVHAGEITHDVVARALGFGARPAAVAVR
jgi:alanine dehydrogenase